MFAIHSPVMFHVFPVVRGRENTKGISDDHRYIIGAGAKERDSHPEMEESRKQQPLLHYNDGIGDVVFATHSPVMFHVFPVVRRRENMTGISDDHRHCIHHWR